MLKLKLNQSGVFLLPILLWEVNEFHEKYGAINFLLVSVEKFLPFSLPLIFHGLWFIAAPRGICGNSGRARKHPNAHNASHAFHFQA